MSLSPKTKKWLEKNAVDSLKGKTVVITGANSGVGFKIAETMSYLGASVILACRNLEKANDARALLAAGYPEANLSVMKLDLADFSSIDAFVRAVREQGRDIDVFVNNAGVLHQPGKKTQDGFELVIGTNYFGVFYLTERLLPYLFSLPHEVTYINTISLIHKYATIDYDDFFSENRYRTMPVYGRSKLCLAKYTYHTAKQLAGSNVHMYMNHPGIAITPMGLNMVGPRVAKLGKLAKVLFNSPEKSSLSVAYILSHPLPAGTIAGPDKGFGGWGYPKVNRPCRKVITGAEELIAFTKNVVYNQAKLSVPAPSSK